MWLVNLTIWREELVRPRPTPGFGSRPTVADGSPVNEVQGVAVDHLVDRHDLAALTAGSVAGVDVGAVAVGFLRWRRRLRCHRGSRHDNRWLAGRAARSAAVEHAAEQPGDEDDGHRGWAAPSTRRSSWAVLAGGNPLLARIRPAGRSVWAGRRLVAGAHARRCFVGSRRASRQVRSCYNLHPSR